MSVSIRVSPFTLTRVNKAEAYTTLRLSPLIETIPTKRALFLSAYRRGFGFHNRR